MARVTVEDCILKIPNRFELVLTASQRTRAISAGASLMVERDNDKNPVVALREIADTDISIGDLKEALIRNHQKMIEIEDEQDDVIDMMEGEEEWEQVRSQSAEAEMADLGMHDVEDDAADAPEGPDAGFGAVAGDDFDDAAGDSY